MVGVCERPPAADGDQARVAVFREDHGCPLPRASAQRPGFSRRLGVQVRSSGAYEANMLRMFDKDDQQETVMVWPSARLLSLDEPMLMILGRDARQQAVTS